MCRGLQDAHQRLEATNLKMACDPEMTGGSRSPRCDSISWDGPLELVDIHSLDILLSKWKRAGLCLPHDQIDSETTEQRANSEIENSNTTADQTREIVTNHGWTYANIIEMSSVVSEGEPKGHSIVGRMRHRPVHHGHAGHGFGI